MPRPVHLNGNNVVPRADVGFGGRRSCLDGLDAQKDFFPPVHRARFLPDRYPDADILPARLYVHGQVLFLGIIRGIAVAARRHIGFERGLQHGFGVKRIGIERVFRQYVFENAEIDGIPRGGTLPRGVAHQLFQRLEIEFPVGRAGEMKGEQNRNGEKKRRNRNPQGIEDRRRVHAYHNALPALRLLLFGGFRRVFRAADFGRRSGFRRRLRSGFLGQNRFHSVFIRFHGVPPSAVIQYTSEMCVA